LQLAKDFDVVTIFNAVCYLNNPEEFVGLLAREMRPGAKIIIKDFDLGFMHFSTISPATWGDLIQKAMTGNGQDNPLPYDNFFGRRVHQLHKAHDFTTHENSVWTQHVNFPFSESARKYIWENIRSLLDQSKCQPTDATKSYFLSTFSVDGGWFYTDPTSIFIENEFLTVLTV
jgi:hypothetical protein